MAPTVERGFINEQQLERQMGCMAGFFQIFDRHQMLTGKRIYSTRRLASFPAAGSTSPSERSEVSSMSALKESHPSPPPEPCTSPPESAPEEVPARPSLPLPLPVFDFKDGFKPWKLRESPRLSLDSRAVVDAKGKLRPREIRTVVSVPSGNKSDPSETAESDRQRRSPSVVARLMGLDALPDAGGIGTDVESNRAELRRSASESRVPRDPSYYRFVDVTSFEKMSLPESRPISAEEFFRRTNVADFTLMTNANKADRLPRATALPPLQRKSYFDAEDFFPEPKSSASLYGEIEKRLRKRGIDEPARDLETLKQILEALQLKGLLHSKPSDRRNLIYDNDSLISGDSPIVVMKPAAKPPRRPFGEQSPPPFRSSPSRRSFPGAPENINPIRRVRSIDRSIVRGNDKRNRAPRSPESPPPARRRPSNVAEPQRTAQPQRRISAVNSPRTSPKRVTPDPLAVRSPRIRRPVQEVSPKARIYSPAEEDTATTISESSISTSSQLDFERPRSEGYRSGRSLLERCDKLLNSIAAFTAGGEQLTAPDQQPSPVSVLDSSPYLGGEECSPSPVLYRSIDFKDHQLVEWDDDQCDASTPTVGSNNGDESVGDGEEEVNDVDYVYLSQVVRASSNRRLDSADDVFLALEKRCYAPDASKAARLRRRLLFDTVSEILDRKRHLSPWEAFTRARPLSATVAGSGGIPLVRQVWAEVRRINEQVPTDDFNDVTCGAIRKDMAGDHLDGGDWGAQPAAEMSDAVLQIERQIFKDLIADAIRDLADVSAKSRPLFPRRKLVF